VIEPIGNDVNSFKMIEKTAPIRDTAMLIKRAIPKN
jgi:hypothetical protein